MSEMTSTGVKFACIAAIDLKRGIGKNNQLPWHIPSEMKFFSRKTSDVQTQGKQNAVIMGRKNWFSIPKKYRPLKDRVNIVLSTTLSEKPQGADHLCGSLDEALKMLAAEPFTNTIEKVFVIGGSVLYKDAIAHPDCNRLYVTHIEKEFDCNVFFPEFDENIYKLVSDPDDVPSGEQEDKGIRYKFCVYDRQ